MDRLTLTKNQFYGIWSVNSHGTNSAYPTTIQCVVREFGHLQTFPQILDLYIHNCMSTVTSVVNLGGRSV